MIYNFDQIFSVMRYPAGESHIAIRNHVPENPVIVHPYCRTFEDICNVLTAEEILAEMGELSAAWFIPYFPFSRHDRRRFRGDGLELKIALNLLKKTNVITLDPHSDVSGMLPHIPQSEVVKAIDEEFGIFKNNPVIVIPDTGATKKAYTWATGRDIAQAYKVRDVNTGKLSGFDVAPANFYNRPCVIVDDICDGGGTFLGLADILKKRGAASLTLVVTHGLFTQGVTELRKRFDKIICISNADQHSLLSEHGILTISYAKMFQRGIFV